MQLSSTDPSSIRKLSVQSFFVAILLGFMLLPDLSSILKTDPQRAEIQTEAVVLDVSQAPPSRSGQHRLWIKFEYDTSDGTRYVRRRRVRTTRNISIGQHITVSYRKRRPQYGRVVSLSPLPSKVRSPKLQTGSRTSLTRWLIATIPLALMGFGVYLFLTGGRKSSRKKAQIGRASSVEQPDHSQSQKRVNPKTTFPSKHKSKVIQRAGWL